MKHILLINKLFISIVLDHEKKMMAETIALYSTYEQAIFLYVTIWFKIDEFNKLLRLHNFSKIKGESSYLIITLPFTFLIGIIYYSFNFLNQHQWLIKMTFYSILYTHALALNNS